MVNVASSDDVQVSYFPFCASHHSSALELGWPHADSKLRAKLHLDVFVESLLNHHDYRSAHTCTINGDLALQHVHTNKER